MIVDSYGWDRSCGLKTTGSPKGKTFGPPTPLGLCPSNLEWKGGVKMKKLEPKTKRCGREDC